MQPSNTNEIPSGKIGDFTVSNLEKISVYWIKWRNTGSYYFQCDSMKEYIEKINNLRDFPKLTKHFEYSHELTT